MFALWYNVKCISTSQFNAKILTELHCIQYNVYRYSPVAPPSLTDFQYPWFLVFSWSIAIHSLCHICWCCIPPLGFHLIIPPSPPPCSLIGCHCFHSACHETNQRRQRVHTWAIGNCWLCWSGFKSCSVIKGVANVRSNRFSKTPLPADIFTFPSTQFFKMIIDNDKDIRF